MDRQAGDRGVEPLLPDLESGVMPLYQSPKSGRRFTGPRPVTHMSTSAEKGRAAPARIKPHADMRKKGKMHAIISSKGFGPLSPGRCPGAIPLYQPLIKRTGLRFGSPFYVFYIISACMAYDRSFSGVCLFFRICIRSSLFCPLPCVCPDAWLSDLLLFVVMCSRLPF